MAVSAHATVIVLEHDGGLRSLARRVLAGQAYHVLEARNAAAVLQIAESEQTIDLLICDVDTPHLRARSLLAELRSLRPEAGVVFSSARSDTELLGHGFDIGMDPMLKRPFNGTMLMDAVRAALRVEAFVALDLS